jgi:diacylglycerol kinase family enzyme
MYEINSTYEGKIAAIKAGKLFLQDVGKVEYEESKVKQVRYFANAAGVGFDAEVARRTNRLKEHGHRGKILYMGSLVRALFDYKPSFINLAIDGEKLGGTIFSLTVGIGRYNGGGMMQLPNAISDDGLFDVTVIRQIRRFEVIRNIYRLYNGTILLHPKISGYTGKSVVISSDLPIGLEVDGESLGVSPFTFSIVPKSINVLVGADFHSVTSPATTIIDTE